MLAVKGVSTLTIEIVYFDGCPNWRLAHQRVLEVLAAQGPSGAEVRLHLVNDPEEAEQAGMHGSPTILVDGHDPFPAAGDNVWSCRLYRNPSGFEGAPSIVALTDVLH